MNTLFQSDEIITTRRMDSGKHEYWTRIGNYEQPVVGGQSSSSFVPNVIKTEVPLDCGDPTNKNLSLHYFGERIEKV